MFYAGSYGGLRDATMNAAKQGLLDGAAPAKGAPAGKGEKGKKK